MGENTLLMLFLTLYIPIGCFTSFLIYSLLDMNNINGEQLLSLTNYKTRIWFSNHPNVYALAVLTAFLVIMLIWPYVLYKLNKIYDNGNY